MKMADEIYAENVSIPLRYSTTRATVAYTSALIDLKVSIPLRYSTTFLGVVTLVTSVITGIGVNSS